MNSYQIYNLAWLIVWALLGIGGLFGIIMGNVAHVATVTASVILGTTFLCDSEEGESLKDLAVRTVRKLISRK